MLSAGKVVGHGTPAELANADNEWVRQFMNALPDGPVRFHYPAPAIGQDLSL